MEYGFWKKLAKPIIGLSPMDGVTDAAFRYMVAKHGQPSVIFTEFTSVEGLKYGAVKALTNLEYNQIERPIVAQFYGKDPQAFYQATIIAAHLGFDGIDINMGCPSKGVAGNGAGAALISQTELAAKIIQNCQTAAMDWYNGVSIDQIELHPNILAEISQHDAPAKRNHLPISVKTRIGYHQIETEQWINQLIHHQPALISLHGRTLKQMYSGSSNWEEIGKASALAHQYGIMILGNGDIRDLAQAKDKCQKYNLDGILIGRASLGNPGIFQNFDFKHNQKLKLAIEHSHYYQQTSGGQNFPPIKKHLGWYCKDFPNAKELRLKLMNAENASQVEQLIEEHIGNHSEDDNVKSV